MDAISLDTELGTQNWGHRIGDTELGAQNWRHRIGSIEGPDEDRKPADSADSIEKLSY